MVFALPCCREFCVQAWDCGQQQTQECQVRGAPCEWGGAQYNAFFSGGQQQQQQQHYQQQQQQQQNTDAIWS
jgi:hypothetical protein